jgi:hypothetical protein
MPKQTQIIAMLVMPIPMQVLVDSGLACWLNRAASQCVGGGDFAAAIGAGSQQPTNHSMAHARVRSSGAHGCHR